jgi:hypothetical protein
LAGVTAGRRISHVREASFEVARHTHPLSKTEIGTPPLPMFAGWGGVAPGHISHGR